MQSEQIAGFRHEWSELIVTTSVARQLIPETDPTMGLDHLQLKAAAVQLQIGGPKHQGTTGQ